MLHRGTLQHFNHEICLCSVDERRYPTEPCVHSVCISSCTARVRPGKKVPSACSEACGLHVGGGMLLFPQCSRDHVDLRGGTSNALSHDPVSTTIGQPWSREDPVPFPRPAAVDTRYHKSQPSNGDTSVSEGARAHLHTTKKNRTNEA